ncbi:MAG: ATP-binding cassette domain-containing protein [Clostridia bacterium]|nr:ATP-binding cassette domain-containing protein [Clostridia bacterium]
MISIKEVTYRYKKGKDVLKDINLTIQDKETVVIMGKNGSGKSTLGKLIAGMIKPKEGNILVDNLDLSDRKNKEEIRKKIGMIFQNPENQIIFNNIQDEISFALKDLDSKEVQKRIQQCLKKVHMEEKIEEDLYQLSLGQKQRIVISEVLAKQPQYIILDEPTTMIDSMGKEKIYHIVEQLKKEGYTIVYITNVAEEMLLADRIILLEEGKLVEEIKKEELLDKIETFQKYDIKVPILLQLLQELKKEGIEIPYTNYSIKEIASKIKEMIKK